MFGIILVYTRIFKKVKRLLMKIFIVDDDEFCLSLYEQQLFSLGYTNVHTINNGQECITRLNEMPDIVLLDHGMENFNGLEVLKKIKSVNPDIYVVFLSGQEDFSVLVDTLQSGAFEYIIKSNQDIYNIKKVLTKIESAKTSLNKIDNNYRV
jgi:polysaccharide export outer membrane protein